MMDARESTPGVHESGARESHDTVHCQRGCLARVVRRDFFRYITEFAEPQPHCDILYNSTRPAYIVHPALERVADAQAANCQLETPCQVQMGPSLWSFH